MNQAKINPQNNIKNMPEELQDFNWAAFLLTFIWGLKFKAWITLLAIPLLLIQLPFGLNWLLLIILQLYCGANGNKWAYRQEYWKKPKDFRITQMKWAAVALGFYIIVPVLLLSVSTKFLNNINNLPELINNAQCLHAYKVATKDIQATYLSNTTSSDDIIRQISRKYKRAEYNENSITINGKTITDSYSIKISKQNNEFCSISGKNCTIVYSYFLKNYSVYTNDCTFYFDNSKNLTPDDYTEKAIKKGINIFKYL